MPHTLLLVEDTLDNRKFLTRLLTFYGYQMLEATNALDGLALLRDTPVDLVLMDLSLPGMDGWTAMRTIRSDATLPQPPIIALTGHALPDDVANAYAAGCDGYVTKPVDIDQLLAEIQRCLS